MAKDDLVILSEILKALSSLQTLRRVDTQFSFKNKDFSLTAYTIKQASGDPLLRIDIKHKEGQ